MCGRGGGVKGMHRLFRNRDNGTITQGQSKVIIYLAKFKVTEDNFNQMINQMKTLIYTSHVYDWPLKAMTARQDLKDKNYLF